jgi:hypothetical protein
MLEKSAQLLVASILILLTHAVASADIPHVINYQGKITDSGGSQVGDGTYTMRFHIYDESTGGTSLWSVSGVKHCIWGFRDEG